jgi:hypothetical protein
VTVQLSSLPHSLQTRVVEQRYFVQALSTALTGHDLRSIEDQAEELRGVAANAMLAVHDARSRAGDYDWRESARIAAIQSLAAAAGASLLDRAATALRRGEQQRLEFVAQTKRALGRAQGPAPSTPGATDARPAPLQTVAPSPTIAAS